jgi:hypothetical protein
MHEYLTGKFGNCSPEIFENLIVNIEKAPKLHGRYLCRAISNFAHWLEYRL